MPVYEFICDKCKTQKELIVKSGTKTIKCAICGRKMLKQLSLCSFKLIGKWGKEGY